MIGMSLPAINRAANKRISRKAGRCIRMEPGCQCRLHRQDAIAALRYMRTLKIKDDKPVWLSVKDGGYGYWDGFNVDESWVSDHVIGIAQGPMLLLIENARSQLVWELMMKNKWVRAGIHEAGFKSMQN